MNTVLASTAVTLLDDLNVKGVQCFALEIKLPKLNLHLHTVKVSRKSCKQCWFNIVVNSKENIKSKI